MCGRHHQARRKTCGTECSTLNLVVWCQSKHVPQGKAAVCQGVNMLSPNIFGVTGTDVVDAYLTGGVDRPAASITRITAAATTSTTTSNTAQAQ